MPASGQELTNSRQLYSPPGNRFQKEAICHFTGPCVTIAGPGSGKTRVLVERILYLIRYYHMDPSRILVLTFSRAAAIEMQQRFRKRSLEISSTPYPVVFGTFHSVFYRILRESTPEPIAIMPSDRQRRLSASLLTRYGASAPTAEDIGEILSLIADSKRRGTFPERGTETCPHIREIARDYNDYLRENSLLDFEDMIGRCEEVLRSNPELLHDWQERFQFLLVDEFQDINAGQFRVLQLLAGTRQNLFVVGDDDQSIYGFRGSDPGFMLKFKETFPGASVVHLVINYRCSPEIIEAAGKVIAVNQNRIAKDIRPDGFADRDHQPVVVRSASSESDQYEQICRILTDTPPEDRKRTAIIVRTHLELPGLTTYLDSRSLAWKEYGRSAKAASPSGGSGSPGRSSLEPSHGTRISPGLANSLLAIRSYWQLSEDLGDSDHSGRIRRGDLFAVLNIPERYLLRRDFRKEFCREDELLTMYPPGSREQQEMAALIRNLHVMACLSPAMGYRFLKKQILGGNIPALFRIPDAEWTALDETLMRIAASSRTGSDFLHAMDRPDLLELVQQTSMAHNANRQGNQPAVNLLTMHGSKGLEFDTVILPDLNEGILPNRRAVTGAAIEEERRLLYVAMTRARRRLILLYIRGSKENPRRPTRFLEPLGVLPWE